MEELAEWPAEIHNESGAQATGTKTADAITSVMMPANYLTNIGATFCLFREAYNRLALGERKRVICGKLTYEIIKVRDDANDPVVSFDGLQAK